jgi:parvulin-like peptidyl-prolyl isomerase
MTLIPVMRHSLLALVTATALAGCGGGSINTALPANLPIAETVNGQPVQQVLLDVLAQERKLDLTVPEQRAKALTELTDYILLAQAAAKENYATDPLFAAEVEINRLQGLANATIGKFRSSAQVDDSVLKGEYDQQIARAGTSEYDFSQLLFDNEENALKAAGEAVTKPFDEVFEAWSKKAQQARAFQRVRPAQLPEPLGQALAALKSGETTKVPVKSEYGWHVIHVGAISPFTPPPFDQVKETIRNTLLTQLGEQRLVKLRSDANITVETPDPGKAPAPADLPAKADVPAEPTH